MRYGIHFFFIFADQLAPFSAITTELLSLLREQCPEGLIPSRDSPKRTPIPKSGQDFRVLYAKLSNPHDVSQGWKDLSIKGSECPLSMGIVNNTVLAFVIQDEDEEDNTPEFVVEWPSYEEEEEAEGADDMDEDDDEDEP